MPSDFLVRIVFRDVYVFAISETLLFPLIVDSADIVLHVLDCCINISIRRQMLVIIGQRYPNVSVCEILIDKTLNVFPRILIIQILLSLGVVLFQSLRRNFIHAPELRIYLNLELLSCCYLFECIHDFLSVIEHLLHKPLMHVLKAFRIRCLIVIRDETPPRFLPFLALLHILTRSSCCPYILTFKVSLSCYYPLQGRQNLANPLKIKAFLPPFFLHSRVRFVIIFIGFQI